MDTTCVRESKENNVTQCDGMITSNGFSVPSCQSPVLDKMVNDKTSAKQPVSLADQEVTSLVTEVNSESHQIDITKYFTSACRLGLKPGELYHENWFTLQHAMTAIEIMDTKMDAHMLCSRRVITTSEALQHKQLPLEPFADINELLGIMDELLAALVNWLTGDSLAQSVFICMYMHCTSLVNDKYLHAFCETLRRIVYELRELIIMIGVHDEEDFYTSTNQMPIKRPDSYEIVTESSNTPLYKMDTPELIVHMTNLIQSLNAENDLEIDRLLFCLCSRLSFVCVLLQFVHAMFIHTNPSDNDLLTDLEDKYSVTYPKDSPRNHDLPETIGSNESHPNVWERLLNFCNYVSPYLIELKSLSQSLKETVSVGKVAGQGKHNPKEYTYDLVGFEVFLNQAFLPTYMPRVVYIHERLAAFTYFTGLFENLHTILIKFEEFALWHKCNPYPIHLDLLWASIQKWGQMPCSYVKVLYAEEPLLATCIFSRSFTYFLYFALFRNDNKLDFKPQSLSQLHVECFLSSWLQFECPQYRSSIKDLIERLPGLSTFFTTLSDHLVQIPALYCLNRSRQRSTLMFWLQKIPELYEQCIRVEYVLGIELSELFQHQTEKCVNQKHKSNSPNHLNYHNHFEQSTTTTLPILLNLSKYVSFLYYYMMWDYVNTGFQLELYVPREWTFIYTFLMHLLQYMTNLFNLISVNYLILTPAPLNNNRTALLCNNSNSSNQNKCHCLLCDVNNDAQSQNCANTHDVQHSHIQTNKSRQKRKRNKNMQCDNNRSSITNQNLDNRSNSQCSYPSAALMVVEMRFRHQIFKMNVHRQLSSATLYAIRALYLDSGGEAGVDFELPDQYTELHSFNCVNSRTRFESFAHRLGMFLLPNISPLSDSGNVSSLCDSWTKFITNIISTGHSTSELYMAASKTFKQAESLIQLTLKSICIDEKQLNEKCTPEKSSFALLDTLGPSDDYDQLQTLAKHNAIACRVLSTCEDRRPTSVGATSINDVEQSTSRCNFLRVSFSPVKLDFKFLESGTYPLIRLVSLSSDK